MHPILILTLTLFCFPFPTISQPCQPTFSLQNFLHGTIELSFSTNPPSASTPYLFEAFTSSPSIITSLSSYQVQNLDQIDFVITSSIRGEQIRFEMFTTGMVWSLAKLTFWITARNDIITGVFNIENLSGASIIKTVAYPQSQLLTSSTVLLAMITGIRALSNSNQYFVDVAPVQRNQTEKTFSVLISVGSETAIQRLIVMYIIWDPESAYFSSSGSRVILDNLVGSHYQKVHDTFAPIHYKMIGISRISTQFTQSLHVTMQIDSDYVFSIQNQQKLKSIAITYLTIGERTTHVCGHCQNNEIKVTDRSCTAQCPETTYNFSNYEFGGISCLSCSQKLNEILNKDSCECQPGYIRKDSIFTCITCPSGICPGQETTVRQGFPKYTYPGIYTDVVVSFERNLVNQAEIASIFQVEFDPVRAQPKNIVYSQNVENPSVYRIFFDYDNLPFLEPFTAKYTITKQNQSKETIAISYNIISAGLTTSPIP